MASPAAGKKKDKGGKSDKDQEKSEGKKEKSEMKDKKRKAEGEAVDGGWLKSLLHVASRVCAYACT